MYLNSGPILRDRRLNVRIVFRHLLNVRIVFRHLLNIIIVVSHLTGQIFQEKRDIPGSVHEKLFETSDILSDISMLSGVHSSKL